MVFLMRLFLPLYSPQTGLHPSSLSAGFCEKEKQEDEEEEEGMGRTSILWTLTHVVSAYLFFNFVFIIDTNTDVPPFSPSLPTSTQPKSPSLPSGHHFTVV